jgi:hypothetical protein
MKKAINTYRPQIGSHVSGRVCSNICLSVFLCIFLSACNTAPPVRVGGTSSGYDPLKYGQSQQPTTFDSGNAGTKPSSGVAQDPLKTKTIAVTDISYSEQFRDAFYFEENKIKRSDNAVENNSQSLIPQVIVPQEQPPVDKNPSRYKPGSGADDKSVYMHRVGFLKVQAKIPNVPGVEDIPSAQIPPPPPPLASEQRRNAPNSPSASNSPGDQSTPLGQFQDQQDKIPDPSNASRSSKSSDFEHTYTKKYGIERKINYGEIRGLSGPIKGMLLRSGYRVIQGRPNVERVDQNDDYFDIVKRIKGGDFAGADYVLYGVLSGLSPSEQSAPITGTQNSMAINSLDISVEFSLIDTQTYQVVASFVATGSGSDNRIDGQLEGYKPNYAKIMKQVSSSLAENVAYHLGAQDFIKSDAGQPSPEPRVIPGTEKFRNDETNPRVYR